MKKITTQNVNFYYRDVKFFRGSDKKCFQHIKLLHELKKSILIIPLNKNLLNVRIVNLLSMPVRQNA